MSRIDQDQNNRQTPSSAGTEHSTAPAENEPWVQENTSGNDVSALDQAVDQGASAAEPLLVATTQATDATDLMTLLGTNPDTNSATNPKYTMTEGQVCSMDAPGDTCPSVGFLVASTESTFFPRAYWEQDIIRDSASSSTHTINTIGGVNRLGSLGTGGWSADGSGITPYKSDPGDLVGHVKKLGWLGTDQHDKATSEHSFGFLPGKNGAGAGLASGGTSILPGTGGTGTGFGDRPTGGSTGGGIVLPPSPPIVIPPRITVSRVDGDHYIAPGKMAESDPSGFLLTFTQTGGNAPGSLVINFTLDGTAQAGHEYHSISGWEVYDQNGVLLTNSPVIHTGGNSYSLTLLSGHTSVVLRIPLHDDRLTDATTNIDYTITGGNCALVGDLKGSVQIVDDPSAEAGGWTPPGTPGPIGSSGPLVSIALSDGSHLLTDSSGNPLTSSQVMENTATSTFYQIFMTDRFTGANYGTTDQDISLVVKLGTLNGLIIGDAANPHGNEDFLLDFSPLTGVASSYSFHPATGELRLTVPAGFTGTTPLVFSGKPVADQLVEASNLRETLLVDIVSTHGNESTPGTGCATEVIDVPTLAISVESQTFSESDTSGIHYTVNLSSPSLKPLTITLKVGDAADTATAGSDYVNKIVGPNGQPYTVDASGHVTVTLPAGTTEWKFTLPLKDDHLSEVAEKVTVSILPQVTGAAGEDFLITPSRGSATTTIVDDTNYSHPTHAGGAKLDGPLTQLWMTDSAGNKLSYADAQAVMENGGPVYYKLVLVSRTNPTQEYTAQEDVTISLQANGANGATLTGGATDFGFDVSSLPGATYNPATGTLIIKVPAGTSSVQFTGKPIADTNPESTYKGSGDKSDHTNYTEEKVSLTITGTAGNESSIDTAHKGATTTIVDVPLVSIAADAALVSESDTSGIHYTVNLSSPSLKPLTITLKVGDASDTATAGSDYENKIIGPNGQPYTVDASGHVTVTLPAGTTEWKFTLPLKDDHLSEVAEKVTVSILPQVTGAAGEDFLITPSRGSATTTIVDDTNYSHPTHAGGAKLDGPLVQLWITDSTGNEISYADAQAVMENGGPVYYKLVLVNRANPAQEYTAQEDVTISLQANGANGAVLTGTGNDFDFDVSSLPGATYNPATGKLSITIPTGSKSVQFTAAPTADARVEAQLSGTSWQQESVAISIIKVVGNESSIHAEYKTVTTEIVDVPTASVVASVPYVSESGGVMEFTISLTSPSLVDITIPVSWGGAATATEDYTVTNCTTVTGGGTSTTGVACNGTITIPAGQTSITIKVPVKDDALTEGNETVILQLGEQGGMAGVANDFHVDTSKGSATGTIVDDTVIWPTVPGAGAEPTGHGVLEGPVVRMVACDAAGLPLRDAEGKLLDDCGILEKQGDAYFRPVLLNPDGTLYTATLEQDITVSFTLDASGNNLVFAATAPVGGATGTWSAPSDDFFFDFSGQYTATPVTDSNSGEITGYAVTLTIDKSTYDNASGSGHVLNGMIRADSTSETNEGFTLTVDATQGQESAPGDALTMTVEDIPVVRVSQVESHYSESQGYVDFKLSSSAPFVANQVIWLKITGDIDASDLDVASMPSGSAVEYYTTSGELFLKVTFPPGGQDHIFQVKIRDDALTETAENITVTLLPQGGGTPPPNPDYRVIPTATEKTATATIVDDTKAWPTVPGAGAEPLGHGVLEGPEVRITVDSATGGGATSTATSAQVMENTGAITYKVSLTNQGTNAPYGGEQDDITVTLLVTGQNGALLDGANLDISFGRGTVPSSNWAYDPATGQITITIPAGITDLTFTATPTADMRVEASHSGGVWTQETVSISITSVAGNEASIHAGNNSVTTEIVDVPTASVTVGTPYVSESGGVMEFTISLTSPSLVDITIPVTWGGAATATDDYNSANCVTVTGGGTSTTGVGCNGSITIPAGQTSITIKVPVKDDALTEGNETVILQLGEQGGMAGVANDFHISGTSGNATATIVDDTTIWPTVPGAGTEPAGHGVLEGPEVRLTVSSATGGGATSTATSAQVMENTGSITYKVSLTNQGTNAPYGGEHDDITVTLLVTGQNGALLDGANLDISFGNDTVPSGNWSYNPATGYITITIPAGITDLTFTATPTADARVEASQSGGVWTQESVGIVITKVEGNEAVIGTTNNSVTTTIVDVPTASVVVGTPYVSESGGVMEFTISLTSPSLVDITIPVTWGGMATADDDYTLTNCVTVTGGGTSATGVNCGGSITIPAGQTSITIKVPVTDDALTEGNEAVILQLGEQGGASNPANDFHISATNGNATSTIIDDTVIWTTVPGAGTEPLGHGVLEGPKVRLVYCDLAGNTLVDSSNNPLTAQNIHEQSTGDVYYKLILVDGSGTLYTALQDVTVTLSLQGSSSGNAVCRFKAGGSGEGQDVIFNVSMSNTGASGIVSGPSDNSLTVTHGSNPTLATLNVTIGKGSTGVVFSGKTAPDLVVEGHESFSMTVSTIRGNESSIDTTSHELTTKILDVPRVSLRSDMGTYSESEATFSFIVSMSASSDVDTTINLIWPTGSNVATPGTDFTLTTCTVYYTDVHGAPQSILNVDCSTFVTVPAGATSIRVEVPLNDNAFTASFGIKDIKVELNFESEPGNVATQNYHVDTAKKSSTGSLVDDASPWPSGAKDINGADKPEPANHATLEGPLVKLVLTSCDGTVLSDADAARIMENGGTVIYSLKLVDRANENNPYSGQRDPITVTLDVTGKNGTALNGADNDFTFGNLPAGSTAYNPITGTLVITIPANANQVTFTGKPVADSRPEAPSDGLGGYTQESVTVAINAVTGNEAGKASSQTSTEVTIVDVPTAKIEGAVKYYAESADPTLPPGTQSEMVFTITLTSPSDKPITILLDWGGTATKGTDYTTTGCSVSVGGGAPSTTDCSNTITIPAGQTTVTIRVPITDDMLTETNETVHLTLKPQNAPPTADDYHVDAGKGFAEAVIIDDSKPWPSDGNPAPSWHPGTAPGSGYQEDADYYARADGPRVCIRGVDPASGSDRDLTVMEGVGSTGSITYKVELLDQSDMLINATQPVTVTLDITGLNGAAYGGTSGSEDYYIEPANLQALKDNYGATITIAGGKVTLTVTIPVGQSSFDLTMLTVPDNLSETGRKEYDPQGNFVGNIPDEGFNITVAKVDGNEACAHDTKGTINTTIGEVHDGIRVDITAVEADGILEGQNAQFILRLSAPADEDVWVILEPQGVSSGSGTADGHDFNDAVLKIKIPKGQTSVPVNIAVYNDTFYEGVESFRMQIIHVEGGEAIINASKSYADCSIKDDMNGPVVGISANGGGIFGESSGDAHFTLTLSGPAGNVGNGIPSEPMTVTLKIEGLGTGSDAASLDDFDLSSISSITLAPGTPPGVTVTSVNPATGEIALSIPKDFGNTGEISFGIKLKDDALTELDERFTVSIAKVEGSEGTISKGADKQAEATIKDDTTVVLDGPYVTLSGTKFISESAGDALYEIALQNPDGSPYTALQDVVITIQYQAAPGDGFIGAVGQCDFQIYTTTVTIAAGSTTASFKVGIPDTDCARDNSRFEITLTKAEGNEARIPTNGSNTLKTVIVDDVQGWDDATFGTHNGTTVINPLKDTSDPALGHMHTANGGVLDGPVVNLSGPTGVSENGGRVEYEFSMLKAAVEDITVTLRLTPDAAQSSSRDNSQLADLFGPGTGPNEDVYNIAAIAAKLQAINPGVTITNVTFIDPLDQSKGITFEYTIPSGASSGKVITPIYNDNITEKPHDFTLSIDKLEGSEARPGQDSITTTITDDRQGPPVSVTCFDPDLNSHAGSYVREATIIGDPAHADYFNDKYVQFKIGLPAGKFAEEDIVVRVVLTQGSAKIDRGEAEESGVTREWYDPTPGSPGSGDEYFAYIVTIKKGDTFATLSLEKGIASASDPLNPEFSSDRYTASIESVSGGESQRALGSDYAIADVRQTYTPGPWTSVGLKATAPPVTEGGREIHLTDEGSNTTFSLILSGNNTYGYRHDGAGHGSSPAFVPADPFAGCDGNTDYDITVSLRIVPTSGGLNVNDFDFAQFEALNSFITPGSASWTTDASGSMTLTFTVLAGTKYADVNSSTNKPENIGIDLKLPVATDLAQEGTEYYDIYVLSATNASASSAVEDMGIIDNFTGPVISLHATTLTVVEGGQQEFYLELSAPVTSGFTVTLGYFDGSLTTSTEDAALAGRDYTASPGKLSFSQGSNTLGWVETALGSGIWRYTFTVNIPDDKFSENNEEFTVTIKNVNTVNIGVDPASRDTGVTTTIIDDGNSGPLVYFADAGQSYFEADGGMSFTVNLSAVAVEVVTVRVEIANGSAILGTDYAINASGSNWTYGEDTSFIPPKHFIDITIPTGQTQVTVDFGETLNDKLTESDENFSITIVDVNGGEARIKDGSDADHGTTNESGQTITLKDSLDGPGVSIRADKTDTILGKTEILEADGATGTIGNNNAGVDGKVTFTFDLTDALGAPYPDGGGGNYLAEQDITVTVRLTYAMGDLQGIWEGIKAQHDDISNPLTIVSGTAGPVLNGLSKPDYVEFTLKIPTGARETTWTVDYLYNDKVAENESFTVGIVKVENNEACKGLNSSVTVTVIDDDNAPTPGPDSIFIMVPAKPLPADLTAYQLDGQGVLTNDTDLDGDTLAVKAENVIGTYGQYAIAANGQLTYTLDNTNTTLQKLTSGETLHENTLRYTVTDGYNESTGEATLQIKAGQLLETKTTGKDEWIFGSNKDDIIKGGGGNDVIRAGAGDDTIYDHGDKFATIYGEAGDDALMLKSVGKNASIANASTFHGGSGTDSIALDGNGISVNFTTDEGISRLTSVEMLDISGGNNQITIADAAVTAFKLQMDTPASDIPRIYGQLGDRFSFTAGEGWVAIPGSLVPEYHLYRSTSGETILIHENLALVVTGTGANDTLTPIPNANDTGNYALYGEGGDDSITGKTGDDQLYGGAGDDTLDGGKSAPGTASGGKGTQDALDGGSGNDTLVLRDTTGDKRITGVDFLQADGGSGNDVLRVNSGGINGEVDIDGTTLGVVLDFTHIASTQVRGIETINMADVDGSALPNSIILSEEAFAALSATLDTSEQAQLRITGNPGDRYELTGTGWVYADIVNADSKSWYTYTSGGKDLYVDATLTRKITGTAGADSISGGAENIILIDVGAGNDTVTGGTGNETIYGGDGDDTLRGGTGTNVLYGGTGNDTLYNDSASDRLYGDDLAGMQTGNDVFILRDLTSDLVINDNDFAFIDGGKGVDTIKLAGATQTLDLRASAPPTSKITNVETIDITGTGNNHIILDHTMVDHLSSGLDPAQNQLRVTGNAGDTFELTGDWAYMGRVANNGTPQATGPWMAYETPSGKTVWVSAAIKRVYTGDASDNAFILDDLSGDGTLSGADFSAITGGGGHDTLTIGMGGLTIDFAGLGAGQISGIERINVADPTSTTANHIRLSLATLQGMGIGSGSTLHVDGRSGDSFELTDSWTFTGKITEGADTYFRFTDATGRILLINDRMLPVYTGDTSNNTFSLIDLTGDGTISAADFATITGNGGTDTLTLAGNYSTLDLTGLTSGSVSGVTVIDLSGKGVNSLIADGTTLTNMGVSPGQILYLKGDVTDTADLRGNGWIINPLDKTVIGPDGGTYYKYQDASGKVIAVHENLKRICTGNDAVDDVFTLYDVAGNNGIINGDDFGKIIGGTGNDTLKSGENGLTVDLTGLGAGLVSGIEVIDFTAVTGNHLRLDESSLARIAPDSGVTLKVKGTGTFELEGSNWRFIGNVDANGNSVTANGPYRRYTDGSAFVDVDMNMNRNFVGDSGDNTFLLSNVTGDEFVNRFDMGKVLGKGGIDTMKVDGSDMILQMSGLVSGIITGIEVIDLDNRNNIVTLDFAALKSMGIAPGETLTIKGGPTDSFTLSNPDWQLVSTDPILGCLYKYTEGSDDYFVRTVGGLKRSHLGTIESDVITLDDINSNGIVSADDFVRVNGNTGTDTLKISGTGNILDLTGFTDPQTLLRIDTVDLRGGGDNLIKLDTTAIDQLNRDSTTPLKVLGDAGDTFFFGPDISYLGTSGGVHIYRDDMHNILIHLSDVMQRRYIGGAGNDTFVLDDTNGSGILSGADFANIVGGGGVDTITLGTITGTNISVDLTDITNGQISGVRSIDLTGHGSNNLTLDDTTLGMMGLASGDVLTVTGNAGDTFTLQGNWIYVGAFSGMQRYEDASGSFVDVASALARIQNGTSGDDTFTLHDLNGDGVITAAEIGIISGGSGDDILNLSGTGKILDLTGLGVGTISGVETIDITGSGSNTLILDPATIADMGITELTVKGDSSDFFTLEGSGWAFDSAMSGGGYNAFTTGSVSVKISDAMMPLASGTSGADSLTGGLFGLATTVRGGDGNDTISLVHTGDILEGGSGDDAFLLCRASDSGLTIDGSAFAKIDGGSGADTIKLAGSGNTLDLSALGAGKISGVETIDITGSGSNHIMLSGAGIAQMGGTITVEGGPGDTFELTDAANWTLSSSSGGYYTLTDGTNTLRIGDNLTRTLNAPPSGGTLSNRFPADILNGGAGDDTFLLNDSNGDGRVSGADFVSVTGGGGNDILRVDGTAMTLDMDSLVSVTNVAGIDLNDNTNVLLIDGTALATLGLVVTATGGASDSLELLGAGWSYDSSSGGYHTFLNGSSSLKIAEAIARTVNGTSANDTLHAYTSRDVLHGNGGDDVFVLNASAAMVTAADIGGIVGGSGGQDLLRLGDTGVELDLRSLGTGVISGVEGIDLAATPGATLLALDGNTIDAMGLTSLTVKTDASDKVTLHGGWSFDGTSFLCGGKSLAVTGGGSVAISAASGDNVALSGDWSFDSVDNCYKLVGNTDIAGVTVAGADTVRLTPVAGATVTGSSGDELFVIGDVVGGDGLITSADYTALSGGGGNDVLQLLDNSGTLDLTLLSADAIGRIDLGDNNSLILNVAAVEAMASSSGPVRQLIVDGGAGTTEVTMTESGKTWTNTGVDNGYTVYSNLDTGIELQLLLQNIATIND